MCWGESDIPVSCGGKHFLCSLFGMFQGGMVQQMELHLEF